MHRLLFDVPSDFESRRLHLRCYRAGDGPCYHSVLLKNRDHLTRFESENVVMEATSEEEAEIIVRDLAAAWIARRSFFIGAFDKENGQFVAQVYVGAVNWNLPEFEIGFFVDKDHEGQGYITEAVKATLLFIFHHLKAHRVSAECDETNVRSFRVLERCGFIKEGIFRENKRNADGSITGTIHYGLLRQGFEDMERSAGTSR